MLVTCQVGDGEGPGRWAEQWGEMDLLTGQSGNV